MTGWLRCVDHARGDECYWLNPAAIAYLRRVDDWWRAYDMAGNAHDIASLDDQAVEALISGHRPGRSQETT